MEDIYVCMYIVYKKIEQSGGLKRLQEEVEKEQEEHIIYIVSYT